MVDGIDIFADIAVNLAGCSAAVRDGDTTILKQVSPDARREYSAQCLRQAG